MSSATSTERERPARRSRRPRTPAPPAAPAAPDRAGLQPWQFFFISTLGLASLTAVLLRHLGPAAVVLAVATVCAAGYAAFMVFRTLHPLVGGEEGEQAVMLGGRTRGALDRDKVLTLRALKELEFDHAMGKVAERDFEEMRDRLRSRAMRLLKQLDGAAAYHAQIERDLAARLSASGPPTALPLPACAACGTANEGDARFCKMCGTRLATGEDQHA